MVEDLICLKLVAKVVQIVACLKGRPVRNEMRGSNEDYKLIEIMEDAQDVRVLDGNGIAAYLIG